MGLWSDQTALHSSAKGEEEKGGGGGGGGVGCQSVSANRTSSGSCLQFYRAAAMSPSARS